MKLTREQRAAIFAGELPRIAGEGECPWKPGDTYRASAKVTVTVLEVRPVKPRLVRGVMSKPGWSLRYVVEDLRDHPRLLRPNPHPMDFDAMRKARDEYGYPLDPPDPDTLRQAGIESAYTSSRASGIEDAGEAVGETTLKQFAEEARQRLRRERQAEYDRKMARSRAASLREVELRARQRGVDVSGDLGEIDSLVERMRRKLDDGNGEKAA